MRALLDTCVVSELLRVKPEPAVESKVNALGEDAYISVITIGEISLGARLLDVGQWQRDLLDQLAKVELRFAQRTFPIDAEIARLWGQLTAKMRKAGRQVAPADGLIAATALHHRLPVMTRNVRDFTPTGVGVIDPWPK